MISHDYLPGQRWFSTAEPELGLATVMRVAGRSVQVVFTGCGTIRQYAITAAPLVRAAFGAGDHIRIDGEELRVERAESHDGLLVYHCGDRAHAEGELDAEQPVSRADTRLLSGRVDRGDQFELRHELLKRRASARVHPGWGILGARVELIPHQLRVAHAAAHRRPPRLLLADEVGLGKTIEACMILAQQMAAGRVRRALVLVPESLVNQWFIELLRRFNLACAIFDQERCEAIKSGTPGQNPFDEDQLVIASIDWLASDAAHADQAMAADWDMLLVDEAHRLSGDASDDSGSDAYRLVERLARSTASVLLLTATPEQLGLSGHFARLRLLDPARYSDLEQFEREVDRYQRVSQAVGALLEARRPTGEELAAICELLGPGAEARLADTELSDPTATGRLIDELIDRHGTGRVMLRNRRAAIGGFPKRVRHIEVLEPDDEPALSTVLRAEFAHDVGMSAHEPVHDYQRDPRLDWLLRLQASIAPAKLLVVCRSRGKVQALEDALRHRSGLKVARFHEDMTLLQRDRNAAWFAEPGGADLLIASEIGAEGRNFQFAQHLVLWDLPVDPDQLEQRIGRLDRVGQPGDVNLHVAAVSGSPQHALLRWYDEALDAFTDIVADGTELRRRFSADLLAAAVQQPDPGSSDGGLEALIERTRACHKALGDRISQGRDRLLELASQRGTGEDVLLAALQENDQSAASDDFWLRLLESFGIHHEQHGEGLWQLDPEYLAVEGFEELKHGPRTACFDRTQALARDDLLYLRDDHPMLLAASEMLLCSETGNAAFLVDELPPRTVMLEAVFIVECLAPARLDAERFLPPLPLHCVADTRMKPRPDFRPSPRALLRARERAFDLEPQRKILGALLPPMLEACRRQAEAQAAEHARAAADLASRTLGAELERLEALARVNAGVRSAELEALRDERTALMDALPRARVRLDSLRLVAGPDFLSLRR